MDRSSFLSLLGPLPNRPEPIAVRTLSETNEGSFTRALIEYENLYNDKIHAYLLTPNRLVRKLPAAIAIHQDGGRRPYNVGKSETAGIAGDNNLHYGLELCLKGFVVLCPDRMGFEDRQLSRSKFAKTFEELPVFLETSGGKLPLTEDLYRGCIANRLQLEGTSLLSMELLELQIGLDILAQDPNVDPKRMAVIGHSAGGWMSAVLMFIDQRIAVGCSSCGTHLVKDIFGHDRLRPANGFGTWWPAGFLRWGDLDDVLAGIAPRPFLETTSDIDDLQIDRIHAKAVRRYAELGLSDRHRVIAYKTTKHEFRKDMRDLSYLWINQWTEAL